MRKGRLKIKEAHPVVGKLKKIMNDRNLTQKALIAYLIVKNNE